MARLYTTGFEWGNIYGEQIGDGQVNVDGTTAGLSTAVVRSGTYSLKGSSTGTGDVGRLQIGGSSAGGITWAVDTDYYVRMYVYCTAVPSTSRSLGSFPVLTKGTFYITSSGYLQYQGNPPASITSTNPLPLNEWVRVEVRFRIDGTTAGNGQAEIRMNGVSEASDTTFDLGIAAGTWTLFGEFGESTGTNIYIDDIAINDASGSFQNSWPGEGKVVLLRPISDAQVGSWTGGSGGTSNLYAAIDNVPPTGTATEDNTTQIESADGSPDNATDEYRANMTTYTNAGIADADTVTLAQAMAMHGEDVNTGTKTGRFWINSNPAQSDPVSANISPFGATGGGALGTFGQEASPYNANWRGTWSDAVDASGVTKGTSPVVHLRKMDTGTRVASVCALGIYVEYVQATDRAPAPTYNRRALQAVNRASVY